METQLPIPNTSGISEKLRSIFSGKLILKLLLAIFIIYLLRSTFVFVPAGHVGVKYDRGSGVLNSTLKEGLNLSIPYWQTVTLFDARLQEYTMSVVPDEGALLRDDSLDAPTSDGQQVTIDATVLFRVNPDKVHEIFKSIGPDYVDKIIRPTSRSQIRMVISRYSATAIYSEKRQEAERVMTTEISELLEPKNILIDKVLLRAVYFSPEYSNSIEQKVIAEQKVKQAEFEVKEATQRAQAKIAEAEGLAKAQALQKANLTSEFIQLEAIKKWNGVMPTVTSGNPFINIPLNK